MIRERIISFINRASCVCKNEYGIIFRDKGVLLLFFGALLIYPFFYSLPYVKENIREIPVAVIDRDNTQMSRQLARMMDASEQMHVYKKYGDMDSVKKDFFEGTVYGVILIPKDFSRKIYRGELANIIVYCDASYFMIYRQVLTGAKTVAMTMSAGVHVKKLMSGGMTQNAAMAFNDPVPLISFPLFNPGGGYASFVVPGVLILILQQTLLIGIGLLLGTAREKGELVSGKSACGRSSTPVLIVGKAAAYFSIYIIHVIYFYVIVYRVFDFPRRSSVPELLFFAVPFLLSCIFLGITICVFFKHRETSIMILLCMSIPALFLSGFSWPVEAMPEWLHYLSFLLPSTAGIDGFLKLNQMGAGVKHVSHNLAVLWVLSVLYFITAWISMRHMMKNKN